MKALSQQEHGFTILEVLMAVTIFGLVMIGIYATWAAIVRGSRAGLSATAASQRARISIKAIEDALVTAQMYTANGRYYYFLADTSDETYGSLSFVARLPATFPGVGRYGAQIVRRVSFYTDADRNLMMEQLPMLVAAVKDQEYQPYRLQLAKDVTLFMFEFWDEVRKEYVNEWAKTNQLPRLVRVALGLGKLPNSQQPQDLVMRTIAIPATAIRPEWQRAFPVGTPVGSPNPGIPPDTVHRGPLPPPR